MSVLSGSFLLHADERYDSIYKYFSLKDNIGKTLEIKQLYIIAASLGFRNSKKIPIEKRGATQTRIEYFDEDQKLLLLNICLADEELKNQIELLSSDEIRSTVKKILDSYANGGMSLLIEKVFQANWDGEKLTENYPHYYYDLSKFILSQSKEVPF